MGQLNPNKYHIADDGKVYRVNEDGSFSSIGNVEDLEKRTSAPSTDKMSPIPSVKVNIEGKERARIIEEQNRIVREKAAITRNIHFRFDGILAINMKMKLFLNGEEIWLLDSCRTYNFNIPCEAEVMELKIKMAFRRAKITLYRNQFKSDAYLHLVYNRFWGSLKFVCEYLV